MAPEFVCRALGGSVPTGEIIIRSFLSDHDIQDPVVRYQVTTRCFLFRIQGHPFLLLALRD
jgi:hypothetical protein